ncbi:hypothetical protein P691DRAFT_781557, partial [Macrolepiota fuliginosa MF-IS2]
STNGLSGLVGCTSHHGVSSWHEGDWGWHDKWWVVDNWVSYHKQCRVDLRTHTPELRAQCHRLKQACCEHNTHGNTNNTSDDNWNNINSNLHEDDNDNGVENDGDDDNDEADKGQNPSMPQHNANHSAPKDIQYHPIINGHCCDVLSNPLPPGAPPPPWEEHSGSDYSPFSS